jgi:hypothetical protein
MTDVINKEGVPSVVSFGDNYRHGWDNNHNLGFGNQLAFQSLSNDHTDLVRDICKSGGDNAVAIEKIGAANSLATEKIGAAAVLVAEKIGAASLLATEKIGSANVLAVTNSQYALSTQLAECCCEVKALILEQSCKLEGVVRQLDTDKANLALSNATAELLAIKYAK